VRWYGTSGKRYGKVFKTRKEAESYAQKLQSQVNLGKADKPKKVTLHEFIKEHEKVMRSQVAYGTLLIHMQTLKLFENYIGDLVVLDRIQPRDAEAFIADRLACGLSTATVNKYIRTLRAIFNLAIEPRGYLQEGQNPFARIRQRKRAEKPIAYVSVEEYRAIMKASEKLWWKAFISLAYGSGLRRGEILNLTWADVDFANQLIRITTKKAGVGILEWEPKDHENRVVLMSDETAQLLADMQVQSKEGHAYIFISPKRLVRIIQNQETSKANFTSQIANNIIRDFDVICRRAGVKKCTLHDLRRLAITNWAQKLPIQVVQQFAGHSDVSTTRKYYLSVRPEDLALAGKILNGILAGVQSD